MFNSFQSRTRIEFHFGGRSFNVTPISLAIGPRWTGRTDFNLISAQGFQVGSVTVLIGAKTVTLRLGSRFLAEIDRAAFREWLVHPREALQVHEVTWFIQTGLTCISIKGSGSFVVPGSCVGHLVAVI
jgi:hypothetical protein